MKIKNLIINALFLTVLFAAVTSCEKEEPVELETQTFSYDFNTGQTVAAYAYNTATGTHPTTLKAELVLEEMEDDQTKITVKLTNPEAGQTYMVHAHNKADPNTTANGTPYNETPNATVVTMSISAADAEASFTSNMSFEELTTEYEGFFVIHDPLQAINTADPTTYVILGDFAR